MNGNAINEGITSKLHGWEYRSGKSGWMRQIRGSEDGEKKRDAESRREGSALLYRQATALERKYPGKEVRGQL